MPRHICASHAGISASASTIRACLHWRGHGARRDRGGPTTASQGSRRSPRGDTRDDTDVTDYNPVRSDSAPGNSSPDVELQPRPGPPPSPRRRPARPRCRPAHAAHVRPPAAHLPARAARHGARARAGRRRLPRLPAAAAAAGPSRRPRDARLRPRGAPSLSRRLGKHVADLPALPRAAPGAAAAPPSQEVPPLQCRRADGSRLLLRAAASPAVATHRVGRVSKKRLKERSISPSRRYRGRSTTTKRPPASTTAKPEQRGGGCGACGARGSGPRQTGHGAAGVVERQDSRHAACARCPQSPLATGAPPSGARQTGHASAAADAGAARRGSGGGVEEAAAADGTAGAGGCGRAS